MHRIARQKRVQLIHLVHSCHGSCSTHTCGKSLPSLSGSACKSDQKSHLFMAVHARVTRSHICLNCRTARSDDLSDIVSRPCSDSRHVTAQVTNSRVIIITVHYYYSFNIRPFTVQKSITQYGQGHCISQSKTAKIITII